MLFESELIYEKKYDPADNMQEYLDSLTEEEKNELCKDYKQQTFEEFMQEIEDSTIIEPLPEKEKHVDDFIMIAKEVSELYEMDIEIRKYKTHVSVSLSFDFGVAMEYLRAVFAFADDLAFFANTRGRAITICIDYYTHAVFRNGHRMH